VTAGREVTVHASKSLYCHHFARRSNFSGKREYSDTVLGIVGVTLGG
jgi:hypothetical protein